MSGILKPKVINGVLNPDGLCLVHAARYMPTLAADGSAYIHSGYSASGGEQSLHTVHFTLNHKVGTHLYSWEDTRYAVIAPFQDAVVENGPPPTLNTVDTFWPTDSRNPLRIGSQSISPHRHTKYGALRIDIIHYLDCAHYYEARAGIEGKSLVVDHGYAHIIGPTGTELGRGQTIVLKTKGEDIEASLEQFRDSHRDFDAKTLDVIEDFSAKILARVSHAKNVALEFGTVEPQVLERTPTTAPQPPVSMQRLLKL